MCDFVTPVVAIAGLALSASSAVQGARNSAAQARVASTNQRRAYNYEKKRYLTESEYNNQLQEHQNETYTENARRAVDASLRSYDMIQDRITQDSVVAGMEIQKIMKDSRAGQAMVVANAADREVAGQSVDYLLDSIAFNELEGVQNVRMEREWRFNENVAAMADVQAQTQARIDSANPQPIPQPALPNPMGATTKPSSMSWILNGAAGALNSVQWYMQQQPRSAPPTQAMAPAPRLPGVYDGQMYTGINSPKPSWVD